MFLRPHLETPEASTSHVANAPRIGSKLHKTGKLEESVFGTPDNKTVDQYRNLFMVAGVYPLQGK